MRFDPEEAEDVERGRAGAQPRTASQDDVPAKRCPSWSTTVASW